MVLLMMITAPGTWCEEGGNKLAPLVAPMGAPAPETGTDLKGFDFIDVDTDVLGDTMDTLW